MEFMALRASVPACMETSDGLVEFTLPRGTILRQGYETKNVRGISYIKMFAGSSLDEITEKGCRECYVSPVSIKRSAVDVDGVIKNYVHETAMAEQSYRRRKDGELRVSRVVAAMMALCLAAMVLMCTGASGLGCILLVVSGLTVCALALCETSNSYKQPNAEAQVAAREEETRKKYTKTIRAMIVS